MINDSNSTCSLSPQELNRFNHFIAHHIGLYFKNSNLEELQHAITEISKAFEYDSPVLCMDWLLSLNCLNRKQVETLSTYLTVGETYFYREKEVFFRMESHVLPKIIQAKQDAGKAKQLRIWCAACSSGEEPYSVAIMLDQIKNLLIGWDIFILATDINVQALEKARNGIYSDWSFRNVPPWLKSTYFSLNSNRQYVIDSSLKNNIKFEYLNLADNIYPSLINHTQNMDIVFCRNVLMYFLKEKARDVLEQLYKTLVMGGCLVVSPTDTFHLDDTVCFKKESPQHSIYLKCKTGDTDDTPKTKPQKSLLSNTSVSTLPGASKKKETITKEDPYKVAMDHYRRGQYAETISILQDEVSKSHTNSDIYALTARSHANLGQLKEAAHWCEKAIATDKLNAAHHYLYATVLLEQGDRGKAADQLKNCIYIDHNYVLAYYTLGNIYQTSQDPANAIKYYRSALGILNTYPNQHIVSQEEGISAGHLSAIIQGTLEMMALPEKWNE